jgi:hypothetical protein
VNVKVSPSVALASVRIRSGAESSSIIVPVAEVVPPVALMIDEMVALKVSFVSSIESAREETVNVLVSEPAAIVAMPETLV